MKLSIITINYNNKAGLEKTIASVMSQTWRDFEWILIDGGSTDGSKEVIENLAKNPDSNISYWCSEPDKGVYNAMNKGIAKAKGEYLHFLNGGDFLIDNNVICDFLNLDCNEDIVAGDIILDGKNDNIIQSPDEENIDYDFFLHGMVKHPASYMKRSLFENYGDYDEHFRIVSDMKYFLEVLLKYNCSYRHWRRVVTDFNTEGISSSTDIHELDLKERQIVFENFMPRYYRSIQKRNQQIKILSNPVKVIIKKIELKIKHIF